MKRSLNNLIKYSLRSKDESKGKVKDFLFDDESWIIRYLEADFGKLFSSKRVLIPRVFLGNPDWEEKEFPIELSEELIKAGPDIQEHVPVSRQYEAELIKHFDLTPYWPYTYAEPSGGSLFFPPRPLVVPPIPADVKEEDVDTNLRSFKEVEGYRINAHEKEMGHIVDLIVDDEDWQIVYAVVDFIKWLPMSKKVLISIEGMQEISYVEREVKVDMTPEQLENAPEYDPDKILHVEEEKKLYDFFSWGMVK
jgi:hypothetical protein